jgi:hypothetical protein
MRIYHFKHRKEKLAHLQNTNKKLHYETAFTTFLNFND